MWSSPRWFTTDGPDFEHFQALSGYPKPEIELRAEVRWRATPWDECPDDLLDPRQVDVGQCTVTFVSGSAGGARFGTRELNERQAGGLLFIQRQVVSQDSGQAGLVGLGGVVPGRVNATKDLDRDLRP